MTNPIISTSSMAYTPEEYRDIINELAKANPQVCVESNRLKKGGSVWVINGYFDEQQKRRLELNQRVLQFLGDGAKAGLLTNPEVIKSIRKFKGRIKRHQTFQNNRWLQKALDLSSTPFFPHESSRSPNNNYIKIEEVRSEFNKHCKDIQQAGVRPTYVKFRPSYCIPIGPPPKVLKKISAVALSVLSELSMMFRLRKLALKLSIKGVKLWSSNAYLRHILVKAYTLNNNDEGTLEHVRAATMLAPKNLGFHQAYMDQIKKMDLEEGITHFFEERIQDPKNSLAVQGEVELRDKLYNKWTILLLSTSYLLDEEACLDLNLEKAFEMGDLSNEEIDKFIMQWKLNKTCLQGMAAKVQLAEFELNRICRQESYLKKNFAMLNADAVLTKEPLLRRMQGSPSPSAIQGSYFLHLVKLNSQKYGLEKFATKFHQAIETSERLFLRNLDSEEKDIFDSEAKDTWEKITNKYSLHQKFDLEHIKEEFIDSNAKSISQLKEGEFHIILTGWYYDGKKTGHAIVMQIIKQSNDHYTLVLINTGDGLTQHRSETVGSKKKYNPYYVIKNIPSTSFQATSPFYNSLIKFEMQESHVKTAKNAYNEFVSILKGIKDDKPAEEKFRRLITAQRSGSCSMSPFQPLLRLHLSPLHYKEVIFRMKAQSILQFHAKLKENLECDIQARKLLEIAMSKHFKRVDKLAKLEGDLGIKHLLAEEEWKQLELIKDALGKF